MATGIDPGRVQPRTLSISSCYRLLQYYHSVATRTTFEYGPTLTTTYGQASNPKIGSSGEDLSFSDEYHIVTQKTVRNYRTISGGLDPELPSAEPAAANEYTAIKLCPSFKYPYTVNRAQQVRLLSAQPAGRSNTEAFYNALGGGSLIGTIPAGTRSSFQDEFEIPLTSAQLRTIAAGGRITFINAQDAELNELTDKSAEIEYLRLYFVHTNRATRGYISEIVPGQYSSLVGNADNTITYLYEGIYSIEPQRYLSVIAENQETGEKIQLAYRKAVNVAHGARGSFTIPAGTLSAGKWTLTFYGTPADTANYYAEDDPYWTAVGQSVSYTVRDNPSSSSVSCDGRPIPMVSWESSAQAAYQVRFGGWDSGARIGSETSLVVPRIFPDGAYSCRVRTATSAGEWSDWTDELFVTIKNQEPGADFSAEVKRRENNAVIQWNRYSGGAGGEPVKTGPIAYLPDAKGDLPLTALSVGIEAVQAGEGDPSPENIRAISGWTGAKIRRTGKNLWGGDAVLADVKDAIPSATVDAAARTVRFRGNAAVNHATICGSLERYAVRFKPDTQYTFFITGQTDGSVGANLRIKYTDGTNYDFNFTAAGEKESLRIVSLAGKSVLALNKVYRNTQFTTLYADECGIFEGVVSSEEFEAYRGAEVAVDWEAAAGEVYGGTLNVLTGELTVTHKKFTVKEVKAAESTYCAVRLGAFGKIAPTAPGDLCNMLVRHSGTVSTMPEGSYLLLNSSGYNQAQANIRLPGVTLSKPAYDAKLAELAEAGTPLEIVYALATPTVYQLTPAQLSTLYGENHIWADSGDVSVEYVADSAEKYAVFRDGRMIAVESPDARQFVDRIGAGGEYEVLAVMPTRYYKPSGALPFRLRLAADVLSTDGGYSWIPLKYTPDRKSQPEEVRTDVTFAYYAGRAKPVPFTTGQRTRVKNFNYIFKSREAARTLRAMEGREVLIKTTRGESIVGVIGEMSWGDARRPVVSFQVREIDGEEDRLEYPIE